MRIPFHINVATEAVHDRVRSVLDSGQWSQGSVSAELEHRVSELTGAEHVIPVANGTVALTLALLTILNRGPDWLEVICPAFTYPATANAIQAAGGNPVFADVDNHGLIDPDHVKSLITDRTAAILPVHLYGQQVDLSRLDFGLPIVEDACQAFGLPVRFGATSFHGSKAVAAGEGGAVFVDDPETAEWIRRFANQGFSGPIPAMPGMNCRLTDIQAAIILGLLDEWDWMRTWRRHLADIYRGGLTPDIVLGSSTCSYFTIRHILRDHIQHQLYLSGIESRVFYPYTLPDLAWFPDADVPNARRLSRQVLSLPIHPWLGAEAFEIVNQINRAIEDYS